MRGFIILVLQIVAYIGLVLSIVGGVVAGENASTMMAVMRQGGPMANPAVAMVLGGVGGLIGGLVVFGTILLLIDIRKQTKRTADILTDLSNRRPPQRPAQATGNAAEGGNARASESADG